MANTSSKPNQHVIHSVNIQNSTYVEVSSSLLLIWADKRTFFIKLQTVRAISKFPCNRENKKPGLCFECQTGNPKMHFQRCMYLFSEKIQQHRSVYSNSFISNNGRHEMSRGPRHFTSKWSVSKCSGTIWTSHQMREWRMQNNIC